MPAKTKDNYSNKSSGASVRDSFQTPRYATELIMPYVPASVGTIWEPCAGTGMISDVLKERWDVVETEVNGNYPYCDFLTDDPPEGLTIGEYPSTAIITNPPFSLKKKFAYKCIEYGVQFALLIPADWSMWIIDTLQNHDCALFVPERRIDYITPHVVKRVNDGENTLYKDFREIPNNLLAKYSSSDFHSIWLTRYFDARERVNFLKLPIADKTRIL